ncbi:MAG: hypothetical protein COS82_05570 [Zetaproteobacteria bacterium CG06_land_8_20_14_3_00_59_53]|nr:MAG: hypothetical protein AUK36_08315 [Zetaproteobacteria bacterium CG2_30_59_37]PIQ64652.1 MAG: hypothetical protein COV97_08220 [Zetaproteobacteria bacterium CG11_big_fil_rev_8_21_14_0_20_59_439]PIU70579.1 MAG: hypothetical protein COS82_05570 [Zetaproteobacteria bacterium CG06_land_8_20_14_3_00_59_53]PIY47770.1 MAG: hypothetical protein COZ02_00810 [Zetaproteobacteria bacterium CG_4_10_14_0_8_um_filter_59_127]PJC18412.1 MAG: hypothetical protein CO062_03865 [Zetaproteobacteria bacterium C
MKKQLVISVFAAILSAVATQGNAETYSAQHEQVKKLFQSNEEKSAKDATWTARNIFKVGVIDNGSRMDGYADYVCMVLNDYGFMNRH